MLVQEALHNPMADRMVPTGGFQHGKGIAETLP
jgi:hypothetical protein